LLQIAPLDLQQVEVIKGASSTLYGGGAVAGLVNLVTKTPNDEPEISVLVNGTSADGIDVSSFFSGRTESIGTTLFTSYNSSDGYDPADIGLSAIPKFERWTVSPRLFLYGEDSELDFGISMVKESRLGGDMDYISGDRSRPAYFEDSDTFRVSSQLEYSKQLTAGRELVVRNSVSRFRRELLVPDSEFGGVQLSSFSEVHLLGGADTFDWVLGLNLWTDEFDQDVTGTAASIDYEQRTLGGFAQATWLYSNNWTIESGLRIDYDDDYGEFVLPRISLLYTGLEDTTLRLGAGLGYKLPTPFSEDAERLQFQGVQPLSPNLLEPERSVGVNADLQHTFELGRVLTLDLNVLLFYTRVNDPLALVEEATDVYFYRQPVSYIDTRGTEINAVWRWDYLKFFLGYTHADVRENGPQLISEALLIPKERVNMVLVYEREEDFRIGLEAYYFSQQNLASGSMSSDYWIFGLMMEKYLGDDVSMFLNFENFTDTRQTRIGPIYSGSISNPQFEDIYAPLDGFVINGGVKLRF
jgi:outer membrane receptor for ferrienterochelin and colicins